MSAALAASKLVMRESLSGLNALGEGLRQRGNEIARVYEFVEIEFSGMGSAVGIHIGGGGNSEMLRDSFYFLLVGARNHGRSAWVCVAESGSQGRGY